MALGWLPNAICVLRMLLVAPIVAALLGARYEIALLLIMIAGASDALDGFLAKTFGWQSELGGLLDPAADKLLLISVFLTLTYVGLVPLPLAAIVVLRDVVIVAGALAYQLMIAPVRGEPMLVSKLNTACQLGFVFLTVASAAFGFRLGGLLTGLGAMVIFTSVSSGLAYVVAWGKRAWRGTHTV
jgi:cardiolipin synthase (CMP-forming)